ncbi:hypothetical protein HDU98_010813 [Podochytrium sp. JEL0797]|nr:hypothetical protein HDU98_010813 [Podochytrium sp. JEL0797]
MGNFNAPSAKGKGPASASDLSETAKAPSTPQGVRVPDRESAKPSVTPTATVAVPAKSRTANAGAVGPSSTSGSRPTSQNHERPVAQTHQPMAESSSRSGIHTPNSSKGKAAQRPLKSLATPREQTTGVSTSSAAAASPASTASAAALNRENPQSHEHAREQTLETEMVEAAKALYRGLPQMVAVHDRYREESDRVLKQFHKLAVNLDSLLIEKTQENSALQGIVNGLESKVREQTELQDSWSDEADILRERLRLAQLRAAENERLSFAYKKVIDLMLSFVPVGNHSALLKHLELAERGSATIQQPLDQSLALSAIQELGTKRAKPDSGHDEMGPSLYKRTLLSHPKLAAPARAVRFQTSDDVIYVPADDE